jgi:hypothetical protein
VWGYFVLGLVPNSQTQSSRLLWEPTEEQGSRKFFPICLVVPPGITINTLSQAPKVCVAHPAFHSSKLSCFGNTTTNSSR